MDTRTYCSGCGHVLGVGRFCTNCGRPVPGRHPEAGPTVADPTVLPAEAPVEPPPVGPLPSAPRFPLYAEEQPPSPAPSVPDPPSPPTVVRPPLPYVPDAPEQQRPEPRTSRGRGALPWLIVVLFVALIAGLGLFLLIETDDDRGADAKDRASDSGPADPGESDDPDDTGDTDDAGTEPDQDGTEGAVSDPDPADVVDLTSGVSAKVPGTAPASRDRNNEPVRFNAKNMWDGKARTAWRTPGDGTGSTLTFDLGEEAVITRVGLINGYAKKDGPVNWYHGNRRILTVQWEFDDGTRVTQDLLDRETMQLIEVGPARTQRVTLHLVKVSKPGGGPNGRDFTAISEVRFLGAPS